MSSAFRTWNRRRKASWAAAFCEKARARSVLLVGVTGGGGRDWEDLVENAIAERSSYTLWSGLDPRVDKAFVLCDGLRLPFASNAFDFVFSNAVIEHVGGEEEQRLFVREHARVGRTWALTTPNLRFPAESHTNALFSHWSPKWRASRPEFTRLLTRSQLRGLLPTGARVVGGEFGPTFIAHSPPPVSTGNAHELPLSP